MTLENLETEVLALPKDVQAELLARLLGRLGESDAVDSEVASIWIEEAALRDRQMENEQTIGVPATEVFQKIRAALQ